MFLHEIGQIRRKLPKYRKLKRTRLLFGFAPEQDRKGGALLKSHHRGWVIWTRKLSNIVESVALRLIQGEALTIRSKTELESVKLVLSKEADDRLNVPNQQDAKRRT